MSSALPDLSEPIRTALLEAVAISSGLGVWQGDPAVFTRVPVPADAPYPMSVVSADVAITDDDYLNSEMPIVVRDVLFIGQLGAPGADHYRVVEDMARQARALFHNKRFAISVPGFHVRDLRCSGPIPGPTDTVDEVSRVVTLVAQLQALP